jgi:arylsulfatase A-like enzyme
MVIQPGSTAVFENVPVHKNGRLTFLLGSPGALGAELKVHVEASDHSAMKEAHALHSFPLPGGKEGWHAFELDLGSLEGKRITLKFEGSRKQNRGAIWVARPILLSEGRRVASGDIPPVIMEEVIQDLMRVFDQADQVLSVPEKPLGVHALVLDREIRTAADREQKGVRAAPDSEFVYSWAIPKNAYLEVRVFNYPEHDLAYQDPGDVEFSVHINGKPLWAARSDFINASQSDMNIYDRLFLRHQLDLSPWSGQEVSLAFKTRRISPDASPRSEYLWRDLLLKRKLEIPRKKATQERPNVLVLCVDALRAHHLGCYGYDRDTSPHLDAWALEKGILFEKAFSPCSWTLPATASLLSGLHPNTHGVLGNTRNYLGDGITTLAEYLAWRGVSTAAFSGNHLVCAPLNFDQGFEFFDEVFETAEGINADLFSWLESCGPFQFFGYVHYMEPHSPYSAPGAYRQHFDPDYVEKRDFSGALPERWRAGKIEKEFTPEEFQHLVNLYDSEIYYWDLQFKALLDRLAALDLLDKTVLIITADHGEEFFEHDGLGHGLTLYNEVIRVPLIVGLPNLKKGMRVTEYVDSTAVYNTVAHLMGFKTPGFTQAESLLPLRGLADRFGALYAATDSNMVGLEARWVSVIEGAMKMVGDLLDDRWYLFDLEKDPGEKIDLQGDLPEKAATLKAQALDWYKNTAEQFPEERVPLSADILERLKALGYNY